MIQSEFFLITKSERKIYTKTWTPKVSPIAVITLVHGFGEHCLRYKPYIEYFTNQGIAFLGFDLQGHGQSDGKRGVIISYDSMLDDMFLALEKTSELFPNVPHFIYGHSMGGNIVLNYLLQRDFKLNGAIITSPWLELTKEPALMLKKMVGFFQKFIPNITIESGLDTTYISTVAKEVDKYDSDPLNHGRISFRLFHEINQRGVWAIENAQNLKLPVLLMHGLADQITSPNASAKVSNSNKVFIEYQTWEGKYHELHNESNRPEVAAKVIEWIKQKI